ncbi:MAG: carboxylesterase/lipase family protein, partial [Bacteroidales bacterium]
MKRILLFLSIAAMAAACNTGNPVLNVSGGKIRGVLTDSSDVLVFKGIPYAAPPVGGLRWQAPQPVLSWEGVRVCDSFGPIAPQPGNAPGTFYGDEFYWQGTPEQSEDCLYLNVWAPARTVGKPGAKLPVAMWIHGGAYMNGYGYEVTMDGDAWARRGVILVTINYRLGTLGFLSHPELTAEQGQSGNYGTMDQIAALRWIRDNIAGFGGDPDNITVLGQSAGAMSVKNLLISPLSRDMMAKAIIQSGGGVGLRNLSPDNAVTQARYDSLGKDVMDVSGLKSLDAMRATSVETVFEAANEYLAAGKGWVMFSPHLDGIVLTEDFDHALLEGTMAPVPVMIGYNKDDMGGLAGETVDRFCAIRDSL